MHPRNLPNLPAFIKSLEFTVPVDELPVTVSALGVAEIAQIMAIAAPVMDKLMLLSEETLARLEVGSPNMGDLVELMELLNSHGDAAVDLVAIGCRQPRDWAGKLLPDRFTYLFALVVMVNADFFSRARPVFSAAGALLGQAKQGQEPEPAASTGPPSSTP